MAKQLSHKAQKFLSHKPERLGNVQGYHFYEHPVFGDESFLRVITPEGDLKIYPDFTMPDGLDFDPEDDLIDA